MRDMLIELLKGEKMNLIKYVLESMERPFVHRELEENNQNTKVITDKASEYSIYFYTHRPSGHREISLHNNTICIVSFADVDETEEEITEETAQIFRTLYNNLD